MSISGRRPFRPSTLRNHLLLLLGLATAGAPLGAQERERDCRCVDREGREIENCVCIRTPVVSGSLELLRPARARIGVSLEEAPEGVRVRGVSPGSPAEAAGLATGDVITGVGGQSLRQALPDPERERALDETGDVAVQRLMVLARDWEPGTIVELEVLRDGELRTLRVEAEAAPRPDVWTFEGFPRGVRVLREGRMGIFADSLRNLRFHLDSLGARLPLMMADSLARVTMMRFGDACVGRPGTWSTFGRDCVDGVVLVELNPELGEYFGATRGVLVAEVAEASTLGLRSGDVILAIGGREVEDPERATRILASYGSDEEVLIRVLRRGEQLEIRGTRR